MVVIFLLFRIDFTVSRFVTMHDFEAESGVCSGQCKQMMRSAASDGLTVLLRLGGDLSYSMEIKSNCNISVRNCRYSTDGPLPDTVNINLANTNIGSFNTTSQTGGGHLWNVFKDSGPMGRHLQLPSGRYILVLFLSVDDHGVEIDKTTLNFNCDADPGLIESNHMGNATLAPMNELTVGEKIGIGIGVIGAFAAIFVAIIAIITLYLKCNN